VLSLPRSVRVFIGSEPVDMRRGHDGLFALVKAHWRFDPFTGHLFVFFGRAHDRVKILFWDRGGFVVFYKRLEKGRFRMPRLPKDTSHVEVDATDLTMLLDGIDERHVRRPPAWQPPIVMDSGSRI
jgi:transposase